MKKIIAILTILVVLSSLTACNATTKSLGGSMTVELPQDEKLINCTWKDDDTFWYLTRPMREDELAEDYTFQCKSNFGVFEGTVYIKESKNDEK